jgi:glycosyltransferase involved in cell wall biosynthesis
MVRVFGGAAALDARSATPFSSAELGAMGIRLPLFLRYGGYTRRKNVPLLLDAWGNVTSGTLVLAGPPHSARETILNGAPDLSRVVVLDYVPEAFLARLLRTATALISTSEYEGFGLPTLEALYAGTPVVAVNTPFTRETCGDAALLVDADAQVLGEAIENIARDEVLADRLRRSGRVQASSFSWQLAAERVLDAYVDATRASQSSR